VDNVALGQEIQTVFRPEWSRLQTQQASAEILERALKVIFQRGWRERRGALAQEGEQIPSVRISTGRGGAGAYLGAGRTV